jgi:hypothetical protein
MQILLEDTITGLVIFLKNNKEKIKNSSILDVILSFFQKGITLNINKEESVLGLKIIINEVKFIIPENIQNLILTIHSLGNGNEILPLIYELNIKIFSNYNLEIQDKNFSKAWFLLIDYLRKISSTNDNDIKAHSFSYIQKILLDKSMILFPKNILHDIFYVVIFTYMDQFLESNNYQSKYKVLDFLSKSFVFYIPSIKNYEKFMDLWYEVLLYFKKYFINNNNSNSELVIIIFCNK